MPHKAKHSADLKCCSQTHNQIQQERTHHTGFKVTESLRVDFEILMITFTAHRGLALEYTADPLTSYEPECNPRSSGKSFLAIPQSNPKTEDDQAFLFASSVEE